MSRHAVILACICLLSAGATTAGALPPRMPQSAAANTAIDESTESARQALHLPPATLPSRDSVSDPLTGTSRVENRPPPTDPQLRGFFTALGTDTMLRIGGYAKLDALYDFRNSGDPDQFIIATIPVGSPRADVSSFNLHSRQTRFSFEARRPTQSGSNLRFYLENDFFGGGGGYQFRLRQAQGQLDNTYAGFGYSAFMDADSLPDTLDFAGPGSAPYLLQTSVRQAFAFSNRNSLTISLETPRTELGASTDVDAASSLPDVVVAARMERDRGHVQLAALWRRLGIAIFMPGERFGAQDTPLIESLRIAKAQSAEFPGFELDVHGLIIEQHASGPRYVVEVLNIGGESAATA